MRNEKLSEVMLRSSMRKLVNRRQSAYLSEGKIDTSSCDFFAENVECL